METKFTKGNWSIDDTRVNGKHVESSWCVSVDGCSLATVTSGPTFGTTDSTQKANAHLIAAAPDMYKLLNELNEHMNSDSCANSDEWIDDIKSLLAKARGEHV